MNRKHCRLLPVLGAVVVSLATCSPARASNSPLPLAPGATTIVTHGSLAWLVHAPADGSAPILSLIHI